MATNLQPEPMTHVELAALLRWIADSVELHDSWEGSLQWTLPEPPLFGEPQPEHDCMVSGVIRVGNLNGQGSIRMLGNVPKNLDVSQE